MLPPNDKEYLAERYPQYSVSDESEMTCVVIPEFELPAGFNQKSADLLIRLAPGYPDVAPDMWWFAPSIQRVDQRPIPCTDVNQCYLGKTWQRWSRHLGQGLWQSGIDSIQSYISIVQKDLKSAVAGLE